jgi:hypothetical protein
VPFHFSLSAVFYVQMKAIQKMARPFGWKAKKSARIPTHRKIFCD